MEQIRREASYPACGRLIVLNSLDDSILDVDRQQSEVRFHRFTSINFPAMPDAIELARRAEYDTSTPWGFPDGIHFYKGTNFLEIPFSFKLHAFDKEYCPHGAKTLLQVAAVLQSLVLPFGPVNQQVSHSFRGDPKANSQTDAKHNSVTNTDTGYTVPENVFPPATCLLELVLTERDSVGIACVGYVREVRVRLGGPFMRGPGISRNLPTTGEFEFSFVHHPGHVNNYTAQGYDSTQEQQAYAQTVRDRLFNTVNLMTTRKGFVGFSDDR